MNDREFDELAREALNSEPFPTEELWAHCVPRPPRWLPSYLELSVAFAVGCALLLALVAPTPSKLIKPAPIAMETYRLRDDTFDSVTGIDGAPQPMLAAVSLAGTVESPDHK